VDVIIGCYVTAACAVASTPTIRNILYNLFSLGQVFAPSSASALTLYRHSISIFLHCWPLVQELKNINPVDPKMMSIAVSLLTAWNLQDLRFSLWCH